MNANEARWVLVIHARVRFARPGNGGIIDGCRCGGPWPCPRYQQALTVLANEPAWTRPDHSYRLIAAVAALLALAFGAWLLLAVIL